MQRAHRFVTICFSHYVERARWALDRYAVPYEEEGHMPFVHIPHVWWIHRGRAGRVDRASGRLSTPVLCTSEGRVLADSRDILEFVDANYAPEGRGLYRDEALHEVEQRWHDRLAPHSRRLAYDACFGTPSTLADIARRNVGGLEALGFRAMMPMARVGMNRYLDLDTDAIERSRSVCREEMDAAAELLAERGPYFGGQEFSGWDLSFAAFAAPLVLPPEYGAWLPPVEAFAARTRELVEEMRAHPAGRHALRMFAEHRRERV